MLLQAVQGTSLSIPRNPVPSGRGVQRSLVAATSLACIANMWVIRELELVPAPLARFQNRLMSVCLPSRVVEPRRISSGYVV